MIKTNFLLTPLSFFLLVAVSLAVFIVKVDNAFAASLSSLSDTQSSIKVSTLSDHTIQFVTPTGITAGQAISLTFSSGYATGTFAVANFDLGTSTSATCSGFADALLQAGAASGLTWGVSQATNTIYLTSGTAVVPANRCIQIKIGSNAVFQASGTSQITNPATATTTGATITIGGTFGDNGVITNNIITNDTVAVTATVAQSFTFTISTSTIYFGALSTGDDKFASSTNPLGDSIETIAHTLGVSTNAPSGYTVTIKGQTLTSLQSASNTITAIGASAASSTIATEQFGIRVTASGGTGSTVSSPYSSPTSYGYNATATTSAVLATGSGATNTTTYSLRYVANVSALTEAGTYVANIVYVATANF